MPTCSVDAVVLGVSAGMIALSAVVLRRLIRSA